MFLKLHAKLRRLVLLKEDHEVRIMKIDSDLQLMSFVSEVWLGKAASKRTIT